MTTDTVTASRRTPLTRRRVVDAALAYIDRHGQDGLSMHKLGAELGVKGMSLYNHVANKDDLLDGVVELLWAQVEAAIPATTDWREGFRSFAQATRAVLLRHPNAARLVVSQHVMPAPALRMVQAHIAAATAGGVPEVQAYAMLRTLTSYALGSALADVGFGTGRVGCAPKVSELLRPGLPDELVGVAEVFCGQSDSDAQFELGLDLMLRGTDQ